MELLSTVILALLAETINSAPLRDVQDYTYQLVGPPPEYSIKVADQLFIAMCKNLNFNPPCVGGDVSPGLCYVVPSFGVTAVQPSKAISGCTLYKGPRCNSDESYLSDVAWPGISDLTADDGFNDDVNSFICY